MPTIDNAVVLIILFLLFITCLSKILTYLSNILDKILYFYYKRKYYKKYIEFIYPYSNDKKYTGIVTDIYLDHANETISSLKIFYIKIYTTIPPVFYFNRFPKQSDGFVILDQYHFKNITFISPE